MKNFFISIIFWLISSVTFAAHPTHMSVVNLSFDASNNKIEYSIHLFQDDINHLITALYHDEIFHTNDTFDLSKNTEKLDRYFTETFQIYYADKLLTPIITKRTSDAHDYRLYFSIPFMSEETNQIRIRNRILLDIYSDQTNLVIYSTNTNEKGLSFNMEKQEQYITLDKL